MPETTPSASRPPEGPSRREVWKMFDRIAPRYDVMNRLMTFRQDVLWRRRMARYLPPGDGLRLLDLATGTGDQIFFLLDQAPQVASAAGLDMSEGMLEIGRAKVLERGLADRVSLRAGDATHIPEVDHSYDAVTISFGIRNVLDVVQALTEMRRVLRPGGRVLVLECSLPSFAPFRFCFLLYLRHVMPWLGGLISGDRSAYRYLNQTVETFPCGETFCDLMRRAGLRNVAAHPQLFGIATIYRGDAPA